MKGVCNGMENTKKFKASEPRKMYWSDEIGGISHCPGCGEKLEMEKHTYLMGGRDRRGELMTSITANDGGCFCPNCSTIVLDRKKFEEFAVLAFNDLAIEISVFGLVDLDAIPDEKADIPIGDDDNPIPLVRFLDDSRLKSKKKKNKDKRNRKRKKQNKHMH